MLGSIIPMAPEDISVDEFFTKFVPDQFHQIQFLLTAVDLSFLKRKEFKMQFDIDGTVYAINFKNGKDLDVIKGPIDKPIITIVVTEKDWRDAVTGKFNAMADGYTGDPATFIDAKRYNALTSLRGAVTMNLKKDDGSTLPLKLVFNATPSPAVTVNLDMLDGMALLNKTTTGPALFIGGKVKFTGDMILLMKMQALM